MPCIPSMINQHQVCLEFAKAQPAQIQGLSGRDSIPKDYGLVFNTDTLGKGKVIYFTMTGMKFPIDMIFIKNNKITLIEYNAKPCSYAASKCPVYGGFPVDYVIETNAGNANLWGVKMFQTFNMKANKNGK